MKQNTYEIIGTILTILVMIYLLIIGIFFISHDISKWYATPALIQPIFLTFGTKFIKDDKK